MYQKGYHSSNYKHGLEILQKLYQDQSKDFPYKTQKSVMQISDKHK